MYTMFLHILVVWYTKSGAKLSQPNLQASPEPKPDRILNPNPKTRLLFHTSWWETFVVASKVLITLIAIEKIL